MFPCSVVGNAFPEKGVANPNAGFVQHYAGEGEAGDLLHSLAAEMPGAAGYSNKS